MGIRVTRENLVSLPDLGPYFMFGLISLVTTPILLLTAIGALEAGMYRDHTILATVHAMFLGWGTSIALGSLHQMTPVVFGTELFSSQLARWTSLPFVIGVSSLVFGFITWRSGALAFGAVIVPTAVSLGLYNVWMSRGASDGRAAQRIRPFVQGALFYLGLTVLAGGMLAINLVTGWLHGAWQQFFSGHVTVGLVGWFGMLVLGISYHLLPFFGLTPKKDVPRWTDTVRMLLHIGIGGHILGSFHIGFSWLVQAATVALASAVALFIWDTRDVFAARPRNKIHPMVTYVRIAHVYLAVLAVVLLFSVVWPPNGKLIMAIGVIGIGGWLTNTILGYLHRILPFFVWHNKYWGRGTEPGVPSFRSMVSVGPAWLGLALYNAGVIGILVGLTFGIPLAAYVILLQVGTVVAAGNLVRTLFR